MRKKKRVEKENLFDEEMKKAAMHGAIAGLKGILEIDPSLETMSAADFIREFVKKTEGWIKNEEEKDG